jgi:hypothetical protein
VAASDDGFFKLNCPKSRNDTNIEKNSEESRLIESNPYSIKSQIEGWSIDEADHTNTRNTKTSQPISTTNDYYRQHEVTTYQALSSNIRPTQVSMNLAREKLPIDRFLPQQILKNLIA